MYTHFSDSDLRDIAKSSNLPYDRDWSSRLHVLFLANAMEQGNSNSDGITFPIHDWTVASDATILYPAKGSGDSKMWSTQYDGAFGFELRTANRARVSLRCNDTNETIISAITDRSGRVHTFPQITKDAPLQMLTRDWMGCHFISTAPFTQYKAIGIQQTHRRDFDSFTDSAEI